MPKHKPTTTKPATEVNLPSGSPVVYHLAANTNTIKFELSGVAANAKFGINFAPNSGFDKGYFDTGFNEPTIPGQTFANGDIVTISIGSQMYNGQQYSVLMKFCDNNGAIKWTCGLVGANTWQPEIQFIGDGITKLEDIQCSKTTSALLSDIEDQSNNVPHNAMLVNNNSTTLSNANPQLDPNSTTSYLPLGAMSGRRELRHLTEVGSTNTSLTAIASATMLLISAAFAAMAWKLKPKTSVKHANITPKKSGN